jgi:DNA polymerase (family 10)
VIPLTKARALAERIVDEIKPFCDLVEIAGSIRRQRPFCGDIDLVILPNDSFKLKQRIFQDSRTQRVIDGDQNLIARLGNGVQLDIFLAHPGKTELFESTPSNFGSLLLARTGSREHNIWMIEKAKRAGMSWNPYHGVYMHRCCVAAATEVDIFRALGLDFIEPQDRER